MRLKETLERYAQDDVLAMYIDSNVGAYHSDKLTTTNVRDLYPYLNNYRYKISIFKPHSILIIMVFKYAIHLQIVDLKEPTKPETQHHQYYNNFETTLANMKDVLYKLEDKFGHELPQELWDLT